jgi:lysophospholipase L1-like esterase
MKFWAAGLLALLALTGCMPPVAPAAARSDDVSAQAAPTGGLNAFFYDLQLLAAGRRKTVTIVQLGDSHTAGDYFTAQLRGDFQAQFGNAGIGTRAAGRPYAGVRQLDMTISQTGRWQYYNSLTEPQFPDYGLSGFTAVSRSAGATLSLTTTDPRGFDLGAVDIAAQPAGGWLSVKVDGLVVAVVSSRGPAGSLIHVPFRSPHGAAQTLLLLAHAPGIEILDWTTARKDAGVVFDEFGIVSATASVTQNWDSGLVRAQLQYLHPALIILAYGTNEGAHPDFSADDYEAMYGTLLNNLHEWSPSSAIVIISPTDGAHHPRGCEAEGCPWVTLPSLAAVRQVQLRLAYAHHVALWDASGPIVQSGGINRWSDETPPLARADHVHFTAAGYSLLADSFYGWLMQHFSDYLKTHH